MATDKLLTQSFTSQRSGRERWGWGDWGVVSTDQLEISAGEHRTVDYFTRSSVRST